MSFTPITFVNGETLITPAKLRHIETQIDEIETDTSDLRTRSGSSLMAEKLATEPTSNDARIYFNTTTGKMNGYDGIVWGEW